MARRARPTASMGAELSPPQPHPPWLPMARRVEVVAERSSAGHPMCVIVLALTASRVMVAAVTAWSAVGRMT